MPAQNDGTQKKRHPGKAKRYTVGNRYAITYCGGGGGNAPDVDGRRGKPT